MGMAAKEVVSKEVALSEEAVSAVVSLEEGGMMEVYLEVARLVVTQVEAVDEQAVPLGS